MMGNQDAWVRTAVTPVRAFVAVLAVVAVAFVGLGHDAAFGASSNVKKACKSLDGLQEDLSDVGQNFSSDSSDSFDSGVFEEVGSAFTKASRSAPKNVKGTLAKLGKLYSSIGDADNAVDAGLKFSREAQQYSKALQKFAKFYATKCIGTSGSAGSSSGSGGSTSSGDGGTLTLPDETVELTSSRCFLQKQTAAGEDIELTAQADGTNDARQNVTVDFTRYAESSSFAGDDITVFVGQLGSSDALNLSGRLDSGAVERSGDTFTVEDIDLLDDATGDTVTISFEIKC
jgi:hypothetical protein